MKKLTLLPAALLLVASLQAQYNSEYLRIGNVQESWNTYDGSIDSAFIYVEHKGLYAEVQLLFDYSVRCTPFTYPYDSLEVQMGFFLPAAAEVTDMWLWVGNLPVQAGIYDRWTASQVYEEIVDRRTDPALLTKTSDTYYELRIFPLLTTLPRRIKITYIVPVTSMLEQVCKVELPLNILKLSNCAILKTCVAYKNSSFLSAAEITQAPLNTFAYLQDPVFGQCIATELTNVAALSELSVQFQNSNTNSFYAAGCYQQSTNDGVYELELDVAEILGVPNQKKTVFLFDFIDQNSALTSANCISLFKNYITDHFDTGDSINILFSGSTISFASSTWVSADPTSLAQFLAIFTTANFTTYSNLQGLLNNGINFISSHGGEGNIVLIASSNTYTNTTNANTLINTVLTTMGNSEIPIHTINLDDVSNLTWLNYYYYHGNDYLYENLSMLTGGEFQTCESYITYNWTTQTFDHMLAYLMPRLSGYFSACSLYIIPQTGFTYSNFILSAPNGFVYFDSPLRQVGKFAGTLPFDVLIVAQTPDGQVHSATLSLAAPDIASIDTAAYDVWAGQHLKSLLSFTQTNSIVYQIILTSIAERVLTPYTAFLALEPNMPSPDSIVIAPGSTGGAVADEDVNAPESVTVTCYPNPVQSVVTISFELSEAARATIEIYDMLGRKVAEKKDLELQTGSNNVNFDLSTLENGYYFYRVVLNESQSYSGKIILMKP